MASSSSSNDNDPDQQPIFPNPTGHEYDAIDKLQAELPAIIDEESQQQVDDYKEACNGGKGPMVACFATGEFLSMFERKHKEAFQLYENTCFRPLHDKSPNGKEVDGTKAYPPACFNLAKMLMTGKGQVPVDRKRAYDVFDRACRAGHGGACHIQAKMLLSPPNALGKGIPYDPYKAMDLYQQVCDLGDSVSCFTLATMLLRGDKINKQARNATPKELKGEEPILQRTNEEDRSSHKSGNKHDDEYYIPRDPKRAEELLKAACRTGAHAPSCFNLAVMYENGDDGVPADKDKAEEYKRKTEKAIQTLGGL
ncbi:Sel1 repeat-containing protein [Nitzschia inconspicua]|uniref:Sel1 repeat-containing protein n=1 Tax=Nitzschia inconspicua TaxID=303405 RepID=A0A9K3M056_9STRA|nr:Sel1 repeat-containing protein [Nitzschia inconspicua]